MDKPFKPVPLQLVLQASTKLDLKAIYRRQQRAVGPFDEEILLTGDDGLPLWDLTTPLPVRRHGDWLKRGFEYVTLADMDSLEKVAPWLKNEGLDPRDFLFHRHFGPWNPKLYSATAAEGDRQSIVRIFDALDKHGIEAYEDITGAPLAETLRQAYAARNAKLKGAAPSTGIAQGATLAPGAVDAAERVARGVHQRAAKANLLDRAAAAVTPKKRRPATKPKDEAVGAKA